MIKVASNIFSAISFHPEEAPLSTGIFKSPEKTTPREKGKANYTYLY
jgi:hypothetical protein